MIEKIEKLLQSSDLNDIMVAIQISYSLPFEEFDAFFDRTVPTGVLPKTHPFYYFGRNNKIYFMGSAYLGRTSVDYNTYEEFKNKHHRNPYIDLTPEDYDRENREINE